MKLSGLVSASSSSCSRPPPRRPRRTACRRSSSGSGRSRSRPARTTSCSSATTSSRRSTAGSSASGRPRAPRRQRPARRRHPPAPRRLAHQRRADVRGRGGEDGRADARRLRLAPPHDATAGMMNHMIHNLTPNADEVFITYEIDFIPDTAPAAAGDAGGAHAVARHRRRRLPGVRRQARQRRPRRPLHVSRTRRRGAPAQRLDGAGRTACSSGAAGHLHPGGLWTDLKLTRDGRTMRLFRSRGEVLRAGGRGLLGRGDDRDAARTGACSCAGRRPERVRHLRQRGAPPGTSRWGSCRRRSTPGGTAARTRSPRTSTCRAWSRTATCRENDNHGGEPFSGCPTRASCSPAPPTTRAIAIARFIYGRGDLNSTGRRGRPPVVRRGHSLTFGNRDAAARRSIHTITACQAPCNRTTGIAYPLADGKVDFDSGELGYGPRRLHGRRRTATRGRRRSACARAPTRTSAASTRSCAGRSG